MRNKDENSLKHNLLLTAIRSGHTDGKRWKKEIMIPATNILYDSRRKGTKMIMDKEGYSKNVRGIIC